MHVREDRGERDVGRQLEGGAGFVVVLARGDFDHQRAQQQRVAGHDPLHRFFGEVEGDLGLVAFLLAAGMQVELHDDVGILVHGDAGVVGVEAGRHAGRPHAEDAGDRGVDRAGGAPAGLGGLGVAEAGAAAGVDGDDGVMHDRAVARPELEGDERFVLLQIQRNHEVLKDVGPVGRHGEGDGDFGNHVGLALAASRS